MAEFDRVLFAHSQASRRMYQQNAQSDMPAKPQPQPLAGAPSFLERGTKRQTDNCKAVRAIAISSTNPAQDHKAAVKGVLAPRSPRKSNTTSRTLMTAIVAIIAAVKADGIPSGRACVKTNMHPVRASRSSRAREQFG
ncbi:hypothetical protein FHT78_004115 [Rhizobium sp. BK196]|nr:hypothetical protein [Rhizobium sp. BK196]